MIVPSVGYLVGRVFCISLVVSGELEVLWSNGPVFLRNSNKTGHIMNYSVPGHTCESAASPAKSSDN